MTGLPVVHVEIMSSGADALRSFYSELFGWQFSEPMGPDYATIVREPNEPGVGGGIGTAPEGYGGHVTFYVGVSDVEAALVQAEGLGGQRMMGPDQVPGGPVIGLFTDPQGHTIGVVDISDM